MVAAVLAAGAAGCVSDFGPHGVPGSADVLWRVASGARDGTFPMEPVANAAGDRVYFPGADYHLRKLAALDGAVQWDVDLGPAILATGWNAVLSRDVVAIPKIDVFAFDTTTGNPRWSFQLPGDEIGYSAIAADNASIYAASRLGRVVALDAATGTPVWTTDVNGGLADRGALNPTLDGDLLVVCTRNTQTSPLRGTIWALESATGRERWHYDFQPERADQPSSCFGGAAFTPGGLVVQPQADGRVFAFDRLSGAVRWTSPRVHVLPATPGDPGSLGDQRWISANGDALVVTSTTGIIVSLDPVSGATRWRVQPYEGSIWQRPSIGGGLVCVSYGAYYVALDLTTGTLRWQDVGMQRDVGGATQLSTRAIIAADRMFIGGRDASYAIRRP